MRTSALLLVSLAAAAAGCDDEGFSAPSCQPGQMIVVFATGDTETTATFDNTGYNFINALSGNDGTLEVRSATGTALALQFPTLVANGDEVSARGQVNLTAPVIQAGNCETGEFTGRLRMDKDGDGAQFVLRDLHRAPFCTGEAVIGDIRGCVRQRP